MKNIEIENSLFQFAMSEFIGQEEGEKAKLVYCYFGLAIFWAQCIEHTFENMIVLDKIANGGKITQEFVDNIYEKIENSKATMGTQIRDVKNAYSISNIHEQGLKAVLDKRNYLAHNFFKVNSFKFYSD